MQCVTFTRVWVGVNSEVGWFCRPRGHGEGLRRNRGDAAGAGAGRL